MKGNSHHKQPISSLLARSFSCIILSPYGVAAQSDLFCYDRSRLANFQGRLQHFNPVRTKFRACFVLYVFSKPCIYTLHLLLYFSLPLFTEEGRFLILFETGRKASLHLIFLQQLTRRGTRNLLPFRCRCAMIPHCEMCCSEICVIIVTFSQTNTSFVCLFSPTLCGGSRLFLLPCLAEMCWVWPKRVLEKRMCCCYTVVDLCVLIVCSTSINRAAFVLPMLVYISKQPPLTPETEPDGEI